MEHFITFLDYAYKYFGVPSIFCMTAWCIKACVKFAKDLTILQKAQKAQMRAQLLEKYEFYSDRKWVSQMELDEWNNQYDAYHELVGPNDVLDDRKKNLIKLPNHPPIQSN